MSEQNSEQRARQIARQMSLAYLHELQHVVRDGVAYYVKNGAWAPGEIIVGERVATYVDGNEVKPS